MNNTQGSGQSTKGSVEKSILTTAFKQLTVEHEVELLLALFRSCEKHPITDGLLYPVNETVHLPLDRPVLLCM